MGTRLLSGIATCLPCLTRSPSFEDWADHDSLSWHEGESETSKENGPDDPLSGTIIEVIPYDPAWPSQFEAIKSDLISDLAVAGAQFLSIEHVGSTAVQGLAGKPEIDVVIIIEDPSHYDKIEEGLIWGLHQGGYTPIGNGGVQDRWSFKLYGILPRRNVYVDVEGSRNLKGYRDLKDTLKTDVVLREKYGQKKLELAQRGWRFGVMEYAIAKNSIIREILENAGWTKEEIDEKEQRVQLLSDDNEEGRGY